MSFLETVLPGLAGMPNSHPVFVHVPLVLWPLAALAWCVGLVRKKDELLTTARWLTHVALASALVTVVAGLRAEDVLGHDSPHHELVHRHKYFMLSTTALGAFASLLAHLTRRRDDRWSRGAVGILLVATVVVMTLGADRGALLVYRHGIGTRVEESPGSSSPSPRDEWPAHGPQQPGEDAPTPPDEHEHGHRH